MRVFDNMGIIAIENEEKSEFTFGCSYLHGGFDGWHSLGNRRV